MDEVHFEQGGAEVHMRKAQHAAVEIATDIAVSAAMKTNMWDASRSRYFTGRETS